jgi:hypothetical protein
LIMTNTDPYAEQLDYIRNHSTHEHAPMVRDVPPAFGGPPLSEASCNCGWTQGPLDPVAISNGATRLVALGACMQHLNEVNKPKPVSMTTLEALDFALGVLSWTRKVDPQRRVAAIASLKALRESITSKAAF